MAETDVLDTSDAGGLVMRGGVVRVVGYALQTLLSVLGIGLVTRHLGVARFGDYATAFSIITVVSSITEAGMTTLAVREYTTVQAEERDWLMRNLLGARLGLTALGIAGGVVVAVVLGFDAPLVVGTALGGIGVGFNIVQSMLAVPLLAQLRVSAATVIELTRQLVLVIVLVLLVALGAGVLPLLAAPIPAGLAAIGLTVALMRGGMPLRPVLARTEWTRIIALTVPVALTMAAGTVYVYIAQVLTELIATPDESGLFAASFRVVVVLGAIPGMVVAIAFPVLSRAARDDEGRLAYAIDRLFTTALLGGGLMALGLSVAAPVAIDVVAGPKFDHADAVLRIQAWALVPTFALAVLSFALLSLRRHRQILVVNLVALAVSAGLTCWLATTDGAKGAAIATVAGEACMAILSYVMLARTTEVAPRARVVLKVVPPLLAGIAVSFLPLPALPGGIAAGAAFAVAALVTRAVPAELRDLLPRR